MFGRAFVTGRYKWMAHLSADNAHSTLNDGDSRNTTCMLLLLEHILTPVLRFLSSFTSVALYVTGFVHENVKFNQD